VNRNDDIITLGGGEVDEMELLVRKIKGASDMVEELPVIDTEDDQPAINEPIEITLGGSDESDDEPAVEIGELDFSTDNYDAYEDDDDPDEDDDDPDEDDDDSDEDDDDSDEDDDDSDEDDEITVGGEAEETEESVNETAAEEHEIKRNPNLPMPVIGPRDLDKVRAAREEARKLVEDASRNSNDQDFRKRFLISSSPHLHCGETTKIVMQDVAFALIPALIMAVVLYGWRSLLLVATCVISCVLAEYVCRRVMNRRQTIDDYSAVVTGILLAFCLPPELNPLFAVIGSIVAIVVVKQLFGGIGSNFANPAVTARIVLMLSFPAAMTTFTHPWAWINKDVDAITSATPLVAPEKYSSLDLLIGNHGGCLGETCAIALLMGGAYLLIRKVISWHIPVAFIGTTVILSLLFGMDPVAQICSGGLLLGAFFMATDYVTSPVNKRGQIVFGIGCGLLTMVIRRFGAMAEGVSFAILLMNILTPHIERITTPKPFGEEGKQV